VFEKLLLNGLWILAVNAMMGRGRILNNRGNAII
jgi:hypothetical protein